MILEAKVIQLGHIEVEASDGRNDVIGQGVVLQRNGKGNVTVIGLSVPEIRALGEFFLGCVTLEIK